MQEEESIVSRTLHGDDVGALALSQPSLFDLQDHQLVFVNVALQVFFGTDWADWSYRIPMLPAFLYTPLACSGHCEAQ